MDCLGYESATYTPTSYTVTFALTPSVALAVPEAGTLSMMLMGLAVVGYGVRRRAAA